MHELLSSSSGRVGVAFFLFLVLISAYVVAAYPLDFGFRIWNNPPLWTDYPKAAPPAWITVFAGPGRVKHMILESAAPARVYGAATYESRLYVFTVSYTFDEPPSFTLFGISNVKYQSMPPFITLSIRRPDGRELVLIKHIVPRPRGGELPPIVRYRETPFTLYLSGDDSVVSAVSDFYRAEFGIELSRGELLRSVDSAIFGSPFGEDKIKVLKGVYTIIVKAVVYNSSDSIGSVKFVIGGSVYGLIGTDALGRDLAVGLLFGFPVALAIGLVTAILTTIIGSLTGIVSGYLGGKTDTCIQRFADILNNVPLLPILLFLTFVFGQKLSIVILILVAFGWPGLTVVIRSMVLQIRSGQLVEAAKSIGASRSRIMLRHIAPQLAPFIFAQMIFFVPSAILAEAGLSFLGLGDPSIPTWGQILEQGFRTGAVYAGYWWWVLPPGLLILLTAITFVLLTLGMEPVVNPRLRRVK